LRPLAPKAPSSQTQALMCILFALAGGAVSLLDLLLSAIDAFSKRWGDLRPERQVQCYNCATTVRLAPPT